MAAVPPLPQKYRVVVFALVGLLTVAAVSAVEGSRGWWYLRQLEEALIRALAVFDIQGERNQGYTGVWTRGRKIASIGIHVRQWVTWHGFALNVTTDLTAFDLIVPCGIPDVVMTSVARESPAAAEGEKLGDAVAAAIVEGMKDVFGYDS